MMNTTLMDINVYNYIYTYATMYIHTYLCIQVAYEDLQSHCLDAYTPSPYHVPYIHQSMVFKHAYP